MMRRVVAMGSDGAAIDRSIRHRFADLAVNFVPPGSFLGADINYRDAEYGFNPGRG